MLEIPKKTHISIIARVNFIAISKTSPLNPIAIIFTSGLAKIIPIILITTAITQTVFIRFDVKSFTLTFPSSASISEQTGI